jgi:hypothetical protein
MISPLWGEDSTNFTTTSDKSQFFPFEKLSYLGRLKTSVNIGHVNIGHVFVNEIYVNVLSKFLKRRDLHQPKSTDRQIKLSEEYSGSTCIIDRIPKYLA